MTTVLRPSEVVLIERQVHDEMQVALAQMLRRERRAGGTGRATALALRRHAGDWRKAAAELDELLARGPPSVEL